MEMGQNLLKYLTFGEETTKIHQSNHVSYRVISESDQGCEPRAPDSVLSAVASDKGEKKREGFDPELYFFRREMQLQSVTVGLCQCMWMSRMTKVGD